MVKNTAIRMRVTIAPISPICLAKPSANSFSGAVFVSSGEFAKQPVDLRRDGLGLPGVLHADDVPAGLALAELARLVEVGDVDEHHVRVALHGRVFRVDDADEVELPVEAAVGPGVDLRGDGQLLADAPAEAVGQPLAGDGASARARAKASRSAGAIVNSGYMAR